MKLPYSVNQDELFEILLNIAPSRPVFIWGAPGIGKSALVEKFADAVGMPCVSLLGSQQRGYIRVPAAEDDSKKGSVCIIPG